MHMVKSILFGSKASVKVEPVKSGHHYSIQVNAKVKAELNESTTLADITSPILLTNCSCKLSESLPHR